MARKAKREGKEPGYYLAVGADPPSVEELQQLRSMVRGCHVQIRRNGRLVVPTFPRRSWLVDDLVTVLLTTNTPLVMCVLPSWQSKDAAFAAWKERHAQHCYAFHLEVTKQPSLTHTRTPLHTRRLMASPLVSAPTYYRPCSCLLASF